MEPLSILKSSDCFNKIWIQDVTPNTLVSENSIKTSEAFEFDYGCVLLWTRENYVLQKDEKQKKKKRIEIR